ncbi:putative oxidoreductase ephD [Mycena venus]|uniref:Putative oxidoreductase ephD n=1 Tax=Mycena venus TaxID=2733690 RepID=A0A8H6U0B0_9AGAR|nr:putative oxidoreductase ephD [Mycena venus]
MLFSLKYLSSAMALLPLVVANTQDIQTRDNIIERRLVEPVIAINPTDANFGISAVAPGRFVTSADGTKIFAEARGNSSKPAIVFIHGFGLGAMAFNEIFDDPLWLDQAYLVRYDTRGHGRSDKPTNAAAWVSQRLAEDFDAVVQSYNLNKPFVLGWYALPVMVHGISSYSYIVGQERRRYSPTLRLSQFLTTIFMQRLILRTFYPSTPQITSLVLFTMQRCQIWLPFSTSERLLFLPSCRVFLRRPMSLNSRPPILISSTSTTPALEWNFYLACLGDGVVQPRATTALLLTRTQNSTGLLQAGTSGALPLLAIFGADDKTIMKQAVLNVIARWQRLNVTTLPGAEHFTWISRPVLFRATVLQWISQNA